MRIQAGRQAARATMETYDSDVEMGETRPNAAGKRVHAPLSDPRGITKQKRMPAQGGRKRDRSPSHGDKKDAGGRKRQPGYEAPKDTSTGTSAPDGTAGIHPQDLSVGENVPPRDGTASYHTGPACGQASPARKVL